MLMFPEVATNVEPAAVVNVPMPSGVVSLSESIVIDVPEISTVELKVVFDLERTLTAPVVEVMSAKSETVLKVD